jgi:hypothetical protein
MHKFFSISLILCAAFAMGQVNAKPAQKKSTDQETPAGTEDCRKMFQAWVFNKSLEDVCDFDKSVSSYIVIATKQICPTLSEKQINSWSAEVLKDMKADVKKIGVQQVCAENKAGHDDLLQSIKERH